MLLFLRERHVSRRVHSRVDGVFHSTFLITARYIRTLDTCTIARMMLETNTNR